ncbi:hypothetical protein F5H01DRAFT_29942 [Linnemannia elongata]|nr:hypothetical protein F5H01DRAFT_29942 [Linnemannia elongata]
MTYSHQTQSMIPSLMYLKTLQPTLPACRHIKKWSTSACVLANCPLGLSTPGPFSTCSMFPWKATTIRSSKNFDPSVTPIFSFISGPVRLFIFLYAQTRRKKNWLARNGR